MLLVAPAGSYRTDSYLRAARAENLELVVASPAREGLIPACRAGIALPPDDRPGALAAVAEDRRRNGDFLAVLGTDDEAVPLAAYLARGLGLAHNDPVAVQCARRKDLARARLQAAGAPVPAFYVFDRDRPRHTRQFGLRFPVVVKPVASSASRGVIRADDPVELAAALARCGRIVDEVAAPGPERSLLLVEEFIPGAEVAVEGYLTEGVLEVLAVFDKPEPLDGPYFEESYYITPCRHGAAARRKIVAAVEQACRAYGLRSGPVHGECRFEQGAVYVLEVAARTIGGLCARLFEIVTGTSLEAYVLARAVGRARPPVALRGGAGVLMIPVPRAGVLRRVEGVAAAAAVPGVEDVVIDVRPGYELVPLPEGGGYLGFIFARSDSAAGAEAALRTAHGQLRIVVAPLWKAQIGEKKPGASARLNAGLAASEI